jgi:hypothetical protein
MYRPGDRVVYTASKHSRHPGPRAERVTPERNGEGYHYDVRKYWIVRAVDADGRLTVVTRRGKERHIAASDERLRPARWWESLFFASRFPPAHSDRSQLPPGQSEMNGGSQVPASS